LERRDADLRFCAACRFLEAELQVVAQIGATIDAVAAAAALRAEDLAEGVAEAAEAVVPGAARRPGAEPRGWIDARVPELVVGRALLRVRENLVGLLRLLEFLGVLVL